VRADGLHVLAGPVVRCTWMIWIYILTAGATNEDVRREVASDVNYLAAVLALCENAVLRSPQILRFAIANTRGASPFFQKGFVAKSVKT
jgi:hypothetical protein